MCKLHVLLYLSIKKELKFSATAYISLSKNINKRQMGILVQ